MRLTTLKKPILKTQHHGWSICHLIIKILRSIKKEIKKNTICKNKFIKLILFYFNFEKNF